MTNRSNWEELTSQTIGLIRSLLKEHPTETKVRISQIFHTVVICTRYTEMDRKLPLMSQDDTNTAEFAIFLTFADKRLTGFSIRELCLPRER